MGRLLLPDVAYSQAAAITIIVLNSISLCSLSFVLGVYIMNWRKIASLPMRLSFYLCLSCLGQAMYVILLNPISIHNIETADPHDSTSGYCIFEGVLKCTFDLSSIIWTTLIIYSIFASVVRNVSLESSELFYLLLAYLLPLILSIIPAIFHLYGYNVYFCWLNSDNETEQFWLKMAYFYIPLWVFFVVNLVLSQITYRKLKGLGLSNRDLTIFKRLMLFPLIMFFTGFFSTIDQIYVFVTGHNVQWLEIIGIILLSLYGFFTSLAYGFNPIIREKAGVCFGGSTEEETQTVDRSSSRDTERLEAELFSMRAQS